MTNVVPIQQAYAAAEERPNEWPDPIPLPFALLPVPAFDTGMLPTELAPWLDDIAERLNVPMDFVGIPAMIAAGSVIGARIGVRPQAHTTWTETANLFGCIVGSPGMLKSPAVMEVLSPIRRLDARAEETYQNELAYFEDQVAVHKLTREAAEKRARKAVNEGNIVEAGQIIGEVREPRPPAAQRFLVSDATVEKLGEICAANPDGVLVYRDELLTLLVDLDCEEKAAARGFIMTGWAGKDHYSFDRIGRGTIRIKRVNLSMLGTTQPTRLANYIRSSLADKNDGMVQRLQLLAWPDATAAWEDCDRHPNSGAREAAFSAFDRLARLTASDVGADRDPFDDGAGIPYLRFDPGAIGLFLDYRRRLEPSLRGDDLPPALVAHLSKYRGLVPRLALICHLASGGYGPVPDSAVAMALEWAAYLEAHARRAYASLSVDHGDLARAIWRKIEKGDLRDGFTEREIYRRNWSNMQKGSRLSEALKLLVECDWLAARTGTNGGRPTTAYFINPKARTPLALAA
jgi:hypothetical protein